VSSVSGSKFRRFDRLIVNLRAVESRKFFQGLWRIRTRVQADLRAKAMIELGSSSRKRIGLSEKRCSVGNL